MIKSLVIKNTIYQLVSRLFVVIISLLTTYLLTRNLGVKIFGQYVFITTFALLFSGLSGLGSNILAIRDASFDKNKASQIFNEVFSFRIQFSVILGLIYILLVLILPQFAEIKTPSLLACLIIPFSAIKTTCQSIFQSKQKFEKSSILELLSAVLFMIFSIIFIFLNQYSLINITLIWVASSFFTAIASLYKIKKEITICLSLRSQIFLKVFRQSLPLGLYFLVYSFYDRGIDSFFLKTFSGAEAVGYYGLSYKIYGNLVLGAAFLMNSLFPVMSQIKENNKEIGKYFKKTFIFLLFFSFVIVLFFNIFSRTIIMLISGQQYLISSSILKVLTISIFFSYINHLCGYLLVVLSEQKTMLKFSIIALLINVLLNLILIPYFSYWAAALVTVFTEVSMTIMSLNYLKKKHNFFFTFKDLLLFIKNHENKNIY